ncbi:serine O-acetyltransferase [Ligilactobacillus ceti]|uniref:Serine acetyltransferase n=1 Tax=Ligilactobacillus ceti DSM 22408 TaxID=1122146 RepID=A0A0R2KP33_9LACO|nr:serine acetyltransferase [Ligilactobacillus ceti]KRN88442.1 hypothetical protein IV53_GL000406 [Ligilactobacillus ceti DSM 22408]
MVNDLIKEDLYRYYGSTSFKSFLKALYRNPGFKYMYFHRKINSTRLTFMKIIYKIILKHLSIRYHFQIPTAVEVGGGFYIGHFGAIVINPKAKLGKNINIHQGVTIGQTNRGNKKGTPIIQDEVWIGINSVIVGAITIGNNVLIAPNSYVNFDVPDNSIVLGNPGKIIPKQEATYAYINRKV